jgi:glycosyltransferase involved in cell wall biosynthesis
MPGMEKPQISVVIPVFNEESSVEPLWREIEAALAPLGRPFEALFVNDGSTDQSRAVLKRLAAENPRVKVLHLKTRSGQSAALAAGFAHARGEFVATLDGDGQNDPAALPAMLALLERESVDAVLGWRQNRRDGPWKKIQSKIGNAVRRAATGDGARDTGCATRVFRREALLRLPRFTNMHRFFPALLRMEGFRYAQMPVNHRPRGAGRSKYGAWNRLWAAAADLLAVRWMRKRRIRYEIEETSP